jgi:hypothetical protein
MSGYFLQQDCGVVGRINNGKLPGNKGSDGENGMKIKNSKVKIK